MNDAKFYTYMAITFGVVFVIGSIVLVKYKSNDIMLLLQVLLMTTLYIRTTMKNNELHAENLRLKGQLHVKEIENELLSKRIKD